MGAVGGEELVRWEKMEEGSEASPGASGGGKMEKIFVSVRLRPLSDKEVAANDPCDWECINETTIIFRNSFPERSMIPTAYTFDRVFRSDCTTKQVYEEGAKEVALSVVSGINSTIFAYGQTSSGKTYTMTGITEYTAADIYEYIHKHEERAFVLKFSAIEIYNEAVKDLLSTDSTPLRLLDDPEKGTVIEKLIEETLRDWNHLKELISVCEGQRKIGETSLNEASSRSHQILRLTIESSTREFLGKGNSSTLAASVNFVDLAGSERASQALSAGARLKEGCHINRSLLTLGTVIRKLSKGRNGHIPYRDSKLTRILQPSLGGNARTAIICTMCPARSHIEQSRNTLLFASCAKEVVTNAQVNIVMSDKALVKQLQKELARLESELRYSGISPSIEALLKEKDAQIRKMEYDIRDLVQQRDLAHSRLDGLMQDVGKDGSLKQWEESSQTSFLNAPYAYEDLLSVSECSYDCSSTKFATSSHQKHLQTLSNPGALSPRHSITNPDLVALSRNQGKEDNEGNLHGDFEEVCKEVRCIEMNESQRNGDSNYLLTEESNGLEHQNTISSEQLHGNHKPDRPSDTGSLSADPVTLEQHLQNVRKTLLNLVKAYPDGSSPWSSWHDPSFRALPFSRSRSCRSTLMSSSSWLQEDSTPPSISLKEFPGRPEGFQSKPVALNFGAQLTKLSIRGSQNSDDSSSFNSQKLLNPEVSSDIDTRTLNNSGELEEMAQVHHKKQLINDQETEWNVVEDVGAQGIAKDVGSESTQSPSRWPQEFEKQQEEIIELWHDCNVSLVHRTYFYMLFKGDPTDSIYMEVELRRLSFLKKSLSRASVDKTAALGQRTTSSSSLKLLRRERDMLCRQMQKILSAAERESLYVKWGIALDSKQRKLQLARCLWSDTKDLEHVRESASIVARLIGLLEQGQALKEMFGLSFSPQHPSSRRAYSWKYGLSSRKCLNNYEEEHQIERKRASLRASLRGGNLRKRASLRGRDYTRERLSSQPPSSAICIIFIFTGVVIERRRQEVLHISAKFTSKYPSGFARRNSSSRDRQTSSLTQLKKPLGSSSKSSRSQLHYRCGEEVVVDL
ncbi:kinesin-like protein KIN-7F [Canna indica]|uniref:Kinesin-like protein KIN-7F n=1 Tax=Canna indica TaxID=4628 RepID=A0AAQ3QCG5_9LILI|nr:kinesin-like protein KIN-7F [Canna indica]